MVEFARVAAEEFSQPLFAHPLAATCMESGLAVGYPGANVHGNPSGIFGAGAGKDGDLKLGTFGCGKTFQQADCDGYSDWFVAAAFVARTGLDARQPGPRLAVRLCLYAGGNPTVSFAKPPRVWSWQREGRRSGHHSRRPSLRSLRPDGLDVGPGWTDDSSPTTPRARPTSPWPCCPTTSRRRWRSFRKYAHNHVTDTQVEYKIDGGCVKCTYRLTVKPYEGTARPGTLFALYPHQWKYAPTKLTDMTYGSVRGTMKVGVGESVRDRSAHPGRAADVPRRRACRTNSACWAT